MPNIPNIRFKGFTDAWEQCKVSDLLEERNEQAPENEDYPLMAFIANEGVAPKGERYDRGALVKDAENKNYKRTELGDFIYSSNNLETGSIGLNNYGNASISPVYSIFKPTGIADSDFIGRRFVRKDFINAMVKWRQGVVYGQWKIHESDFLKIEVAVPSLEEQRKIGLYLSELDNLITLHQRKCDETKLLKKYMLKKMFPQKGVLVPEIRIDGFTDPWEQRKLGELTDRIIVGLATSVTPYYRESGVPLLRNMNIKENYLDDSDILYLEEEYANTNKNKMIHENDVLTVHTGSNIGLTCIAPKQYEGSLSFTTLITTPTDGKLDSLFLMQYMNSSMGKKGIDAIITAGGKPNLNSGDLEKLLVVYPNVTEQKKIGNYFRKLDNLITLHQHRCCELIELKKYMLQNMFPQKG